MIPDLEGFVAEVCDEVGIDPPGATTLIGPDTTFVSLGFDSLALLLVLERFVDDGRPLPLAPTIGWLWSEHLRAGG